MRDIINGKNIVAPIKEKQEGEELRGLAEYPEIEIDNDIHGKEFKVTIWRKGHQASTQENKESTQENILHILKENPKANRKELAEIIGLSEDGIKKQLAKLKKEGQIERIGSTKAGYWKVKAIEIHS